MEKGANGKACLEWPKKPGVYAAVLKNEQHPKAVVCTLAKQLSENQGSRGVYVTFDLPYTMLVDHLLANGIGAKRLYFIDATGIRAGHPVKADECRLMQSPSSLTELSVELTKAMNSGRYDFLVFDAATSLLMHNELEVSERFLHYLASKVRMHGVRGIVIFIIHEESGIEEGLGPQLMKIADSVLKV